MLDKERLNYEQYQTDLHHQASIYESTFVIGEIQGIKKGIEQEQKKSQLKLEQERKKTN